MTVRSEKIRRSSGTKPSPPPDVGEHGLAGDVLPVETHRPPGGRVVSHDAPHGRCLAGAVAAQQADDFTGLHGQADPLEDVALTVVYVDVIEFNHGRHLPGRLP